MTRQQGQIVQSALEASIERLMALVDADEATSKDHKALSLAIAALHLVRGKR